MTTLRLEVITAERQVFADDVNVVVAPGIEGELGILPKHAPLITMLQPGELLIRKDGEETYMAVTGGFLEVRPDKIIILADSCERAEEIDIARAEAAKHRAEESLEPQIADADTAVVEAALRRSLIRLKVAERRRRKPGQYIKGS